MNQPKNILICPLDWGLGHATRCIPMIRELQKENTVYIASSGEAALLLKKEFPELKHFALPSYRITYPVRRSMTWHMALHFPTLLATIWQEKKRIRQLIEDFKINLIISDNRYGAYSPKIPTVFITHQVNIKTPQLNHWVNRKNHQFITKFTQCWIPDFEFEPGLAGELSHPAPQKIKTTYIGPQSRFTSQNLEKIFDITVVLSGPEPQRSILEDELFKQLFTLEHLKINLIRGLYSSNESAQVKNIMVYDHMTSDDLEKMMHQSKNIICRSGYSGIMDLQYVDAKILLIPTPQQTEQEYLAKLHSKNGNYHSQTQNNIDLKEFLESVYLEDKKAENSLVDFNKLVAEILS